MWRRFLLTFILHLSIHRYVWRPSYYIIFTLHIYVYVHTFISSISSFQSLIMDSVVESLLPSVQRKRTKIEHIDWNDFRACVATRHAIQFGSALLWATVIWILKRRVLLACLACLPKTLHSFHLQQHWESDISTTLPAFRSNSTGRQTCCKFACISICKSTDWGLACISKQHYWENDMLQVCVQ